MFNFRTLMIVFFAISFPLMGNAQTQETVPNTGGVKSQANPTMIPREGNNWPQLVTPTTSPNKDSFNQGITDDNGVKVPSNNSDIQLPQNKGSALGVGSGSNIGGAGNK